MRWAHRLTGTGPQAHRHRLICIPCLAPIPHTYAFALRKAGVCTSCLLITSCPLMYTLAVCWQWLASSWVAAQGRHVSSGWCRHVLWWPHACQSLCVQCQILKQPDFSKLNMRGAQGRRDLCEATDVLVFGHGVAKKVEEALCLVGKGSFLLELSAPMHGRQIGLQ